jgi:hypothetical protein
MQTARTTVSADAAQFLKQCHAALREHTGGNPRPFLELWSRAPDVSLMGGVGGHQVGIDAVSTLLTAAAKTLNYQTWDAETLASSLAMSWASPSSWSTSLARSTARQTK